MSHKDIAALLGPQEEIDYRDAVLPLERLNVLIQPRATFPEKKIEELEQSIKANGLINPLTVVQYGPKGASQHLELLNRAQGMNYALEDLVRTGEECYTMLLAGECRYRAIQRLPVDHRFFSEGIPVRIALDILPLRATSLQFSENHHSRPEPHEEARHMVGFYRVLKGEYEELTLTEFARWADRSPDTVRSALRFCDLPASVQEKVEEGTIPYGIGIELARLQEEDVGEEELHRWILQALLTRRTVEEFREDVSSCIAHKRNGQGTLFAPTEDEFRDAIRRVVEREVIQQHWRMTHYFGRLIDHFERGDLGLEDSPYSEGSPVRMFRAQVEQMERLLPHLRGLLPKREYRRAERVLIETEVQTRLLLDNEAARAAKEAVA